MKENKTNQLNLLHKIYLIIIFICQLFPNTIVQVLIAVFICFVYGQIVTLYHE
jgi:hypothetical protein